MKRIIIILSVIINFGACTYHDVVDYEDGDGKIENRTYLNDDLYVEFEYLFCDESLYEEENPKYYLSSRCSVWSENKIEMIFIDIKMRIDDLTLKSENLSVGNLDQNKKYNSFNEFSKEKQIRFGWDIYMGYNYDYVKYENIILEYDIVLKENDKLFKLKGDKKLHRNLRRVRTYSIFGG